MMRQRKKEILRDIFCTNFMGYTFFVSYTTGKVYYFKDDEYSFKVSADCIYLIRKRDRETKVVYSNGEFVTTKRAWLMKSCPQMSRKHYLGIVLRQRKGDSVFTFYLKDHHLIAVLFFGEEAIYAIGDEINEKGKFQINHRNLYIYDNRPENLEIVTGNENLAHGRIMYEVYESLIREKYGADSEIYWLDDQVIDSSLVSRRWIV